MPEYQSPIDELVLAHTILSGVVAAGVFGIATRSGEAAPGWLRNVLCAWWSYALVAAFLLASLAGHIAELVLLLGTYAPPPGARRAAYFSEDVSAVWVCVLGLLVSGVGLYHLPGARRAVW